MLQVVHQFPAAPAGGIPKYLGGTEVYVADLARRLRDRGHQVAIFAGADQAGRENWEGMELTTVVGGLRGPKGPSATFLTTFGNPQTEAAFAEVLHRFRPDVVHIHHLVGLSLQLIAQAQAAGAPVCYTLHDYWFTCPKSQLIDHEDRLCAGPRAGVNCARCAVDRLGAGALMPAAPALAPLFLLRERRVRRAISRADVIFAPSRFIAEMAREKGLPKEKLRQVAFGIETDSLTANRTVRAPGTSLRVMYLGAIEPAKGVHLLLAACRALLPGAVRVSVYGDLTAYPDYSAALQQAAAGLPVQLLGALPRAEVPAALAQADVLVVPSLWYENAPMVITEARAAGMPVVAARVGALPEHVHDGEDGLLFEMGNSADLARVLRRLVDEPGLLERLQHPVSHRTTREQHVAETELVYQELAARRTYAT